MRDLLVEVHLPVRHFERGMKDRQHGMHHLNDVVIWMSTFSLLLLLVYRMRRDNYRLEFQHSVVLGEDYILAK